VNLLREGLDLPEVSLVAILDADKEGFLRNDRSLTQTAGRAARNVNGLVIFYADSVTDSMQRTIDETNRRRSIQMAYNEENNITPRTLAKSREEILARSSVLDIRGKREYYIEPEAPSIAADPIVSHMTRDQVERLIAETESKMKKAAKDLDFITAAQHRDEMLALKERLK
jgi:excinuclease ABC subunit B